MWFNSTPVPLCCQEVSRLHLPLFPAAAVFIKTWSQATSHSASFNIPFQSNPAFCRESKCRTYFQFYRNWRDFQWNNHTGIILWSSVYNFCPNILWHSGQILPAVPKNIWTKVVDKGSSPAAADWNELKALFQCRIACIIDTIWT